MYFYGIDPLYIILVGPCIILSLIASVQVRSTFSRFSAVRPSTGLTGREAARKMLDYAGLTSVRIERVGGSLTDHYDPRTNVLRLSDPVYDKVSVSAIAVACHEAGHAIQKSVSYKPLVLRSTLVPMANIGSNAGPWLLIIGLIVGKDPLVIAGLVLFAVAVLFYLVTLPVEFNASKRALVLMGEAGLVREDEKAMAKKVLTAAAMTYVASALMAIANLLRLVIIANNSKRRN